MHCDTKTILDKVKSSVILVTDDCEVEYENIGGIPAEALSDDVIVVGNEARDNKVIPVSYTHLTLPTNYRV